MPCLGPSDEEYAAYERRQGRAVLIPSEMPAVLCGLFTALGEHVPRILDAVDWTEVGVRREDVEGWWAEHQEADRTRREREARKRSNA